jgi:hypothetical protein
MNSHYRKHYGRVHKIVEGILKPDTHTVYYIDPCGIYIILLTLRVIY